MGPGLLKREDWHRRLSQARTSALTWRLADGLFTSPIITIPEASRLLGVTYASAQRHIEKSVEAEILRPWGNSSYRKAYLASEILGIISDQGT